MKTYYKAFNKDLTCRGFQYEVGKTYKQDGELEICENGFHACENPLDVFNYYDITDSRFCEVEYNGDVVTHSDDSKVAGLEISIKAEIELGDYIKRGVDWLIDCCKKIDGSNVSEGNCSTAASSGNSSTAASSGDYSTAASSGNSSKAASSGYSSKAASSGDYSKAASSGDCSKAASSGDYSKAASSGSYSKAACDTNGFAAVAGINGRVKGNKGSALAIGYKDDEGKNQFLTAHVDGEIIKEDVWYIVKDGVLVEDR